MRKSIFLPLVVSLLFAAAATAADVTGKWVAQVPGRDGQTREVTFDFKVDGSKLTGTMSTRMGEVPIQDGVVKGDEISFVVVLNFGGNEVRMEYNGKVQGDEIHFTRKVGDRPPQEFVARRASS